MKNILKPFGLLMHFLAILVFFFLGIAYANLIEAGKGQMLAGGAIILGYGVVGAFVGLCISIFTAYKTKRKTIFRINIILPLILLALWGFFAIRYKAKQKLKLEQEKPKIEQPKKQTAPAAVNDTAMMYSSEGANFGESTSLGMFSPTIDEHTVLYFYENPTLEKTFRKHIPYDSITFKKTPYGSYDIATAPPWLVPDHLKLDYDMLYFKVQSVSQEFIEVTVNTTTNKTSFINRNAGSLSYWPDFLLNVNSVEFPDPIEQRIYVRPLGNAGTITATYSFMKPLRIKENWMYVELLNDDLIAVEIGWIRWRKDGKLLINYSLLS